MGWLERKIERRAEKVILQATEALDRDLRTVACEVFVNRDAIEDIAGRVPAGYCDANTIRNLAAAVTATNRRLAILLALLSIEDDSPL